MSKQQTALDYLLDNIAYQNEYGQWCNGMHNNANIDNAVRIAKEMQREQIVEANYKGLERLVFSIEQAKEMSANYFTQTYEQ